MIPIFYMLSSLFFQIFKGGVSLFIILCDITYSLFDIYYRTF